MNGTPVVLENLRKAFGRVVALEDLTLDVPPGATYFILGPNGSGKTTLVNLLTGILRPTDGQVRVFGSDPYRRPYETAQRLSVAYENHHLPSWASAKVYLRFITRIRKLGEEEADQASRDFELLDYWERDMGTYSAGMRKRVMLAQAWMGTPDLLVLDEPFSNLDPQGRWLLARLLRKRASAGRTTIVATHLAETLAPPTHLACLLSGRLEEDGPIGDLADRYDARSVEFTVSDPAKGVQLLLERGSGTVSASGDRVSVRGTSDIISAAEEILRDADLSPSRVKEEYDIWAIYRALLTHREPRSFERG